MSGFNGAAGSLPRKRGQHHMTQLSYQRFNGAAGSLPRKPGGSTTSSPSASGFNGAAGSLPRKPVPDLQLRAVGKASMGPRDRSRGNAKDAREIVASNLLQWGRGIAPAETTA